MENGPYHGLHSYNTDANSSLKTLQYFIAQMAINSEKQYMCTFITGQLLMLMDFLILMEAILYILGMSLISDFC